MTEPSKFKALTDHFKVSAVGFLGAWVLRLLFKSLRWKITGIELGENHWSCGPPRILTFWHSQQLLMSWSYLPGVVPGKSKPLVGLISQHGDGRMIAKVVENLKISSIAGSSSRGGRQAMFDMINSLKSGNHVAITPDGPKGPVEELKPGTVRIAQRSGAPIFPVAIAAERKWTFRSWDKMFLPKPFSRAAMVAGPLIHIPAELGEAEMQEYMKIVQEALNDVTRRANQSFGAVDTSES